MPTDDWPFAASVAVLFVIVMLRANATYWAARGLREGANRSRWARHLTGRRFTRAETFVRSWGAPAVTVSFLTVGFQTAVNAAAGAMRMPLKRYLPAVTVGGLIWAVLYATVGFAVINAWLGARGRWWYVVGAVVGLTGLAIWRSRLVRGRRRNGFGESSSPVGLPGCVGEDDDQQRERADKPESIVQSEVASE